MYRGSPPFLPEGPEGTRMYLPSPATHPVGSDHAEGSPCGCPRATHVPPHLRLLAPASRMTPLTHRPLPATIIVTVTPISTFETQDDTVNALAMVVPDEGTDAVKQLHDKVCVCAWVRAYVLLCVSVSVSAHARVFVRAIPLQS